MFRLISVGWPELKYLILKKNMYLQHALGCSIKLFLKLVCINNYSGSFVCKMPICHINQFGT